MYYNYYKDILYIDILYRFAVTRSGLSSSAQLPVEDEYNQYQSYQVNQYYNYYHYLY